MSQQIMNSSDYKNEHSRTIIHIDLDCFYAQVETLKNPDLKNVPLGIQQQHIVVTCNYIAREFGVRKCMLLTEALRLCPNLVLVNGEDLSDYKAMSFKVTNLLQKYSECVERLGCDENFIDVTRLVEDKLKNMKQEVQPSGHIFGNSEHFCPCGCEIRIKLGSCIALEMRKLILEQLGLTSCAGIAHNKLLAKIVCSKHKPNQQTLLYADSASELMLTLNSVECIPGIGRATADLLKDINVKSVKDLQNAEISNLSKLFDGEKAKSLQNLSYGIDRNQVKKSAKPLSIGLEEGCKVICAEVEVKEKLTELLKRLLFSVEADGRIPKTIKLTVRKYDKVVKTSHRESRQTNIHQSIFTSESVSLMSQKNVERILTILMSLFRKIIQVNRPFHITLLGLSFTKFNERPNIKSCITSFLQKDLEVQSITSIEYSNSNDSSPDSAIPSPSSCRESSDPESEPTPKRTKLNIFRRNLVEFDKCESPSKLRVQDLQLNSENHDNNQNVKCPPNADESVFRELPIEVQRDLWSDYKMSRNQIEHCENKSKKVKGNTILNYFVRQ